MDNDHDGELQLEEMQGLMRAIGLAPVDVFGQFMFDPVLYRRRRRRLTS